MAMGGMDNDDENSVALTDINITPFVDVVLVLLVIFIVTAPMMMKDVLQLQLPNAENSDQTEMSPLAVAILKSGQFILNGELVSAEQFRAQALQAFEENNKIQAIIAADLEAQHKYLVEVMDTLKSVGIVNFAIQVEKMVDAP